MFRRSMGLCEGADGQHCTFLASTSRKQLPHILQKLRYRGASAEVGVWRGDYSSMILSGWRSGGKHYLVDPYLAYGDGCPHGGRNLTQAKRKYQSGGQWHCRFEQSAFDACGRAVVDRIEGTLLEAACHWPPLWYLRFAWVRLRPPCRQPLP